MSEKDAFGLRLDTWSIILPGLGALSEFPVI
jgi:hypothetical protein